MNEILTWVEANPLYWLPIYIINVFITGVLVGIEYQRGKSYSKAEAFLWVVFGCFFSTPSVVIASIAKTLKKTNQ